MYRRCGGEAPRIVYLLSVWRLAVSSTLRSVTQYSDHRRFLHVVAKTDSVGNQTPAVQTVDSHFAVDGYLLGCDAVSTCRCL